MGDIQIQVLNGTDMTTVLLKDTLHAPDLGLTVVSISCIVKAGYMVQFVDNSCSIQKGENRPVVGQILVGANGLFKVEHALVADASAEPGDILMRHRKLEHIPGTAICSLIHTRAITGLQLIDDFPPFTCDSCEYAKLT